MPQEVTYIECICKDPNHTVRFSVENYPDEPTMIVINTHLNAYLKFHHRLISGVKYILGLSADKDRPHFDTTILNEDEINRLFVLLHQARSSILKQKEQEKLHVNTVK